MKKTPKKSKIFENLEIHSTPQSATTSAVVCSENAAATTATIDTSSTAATNTSSTAATNTSSTAATNTLSTAVRNASVVTTSTAVVDTTCAAVTTTAVVEISNTGATCTIAIRGAGAVTTTTPVFDIAKAAASNTNAVIDTNLISSIVVNEEKAANCNIKKASNNKRVLSGTTNHNNAKARKILNMDLSTCIETCTASAHAKDNQMEFDFSRNDEVLAQKLHENLLHTDLDDELSVKYLLKQSFVFRRTTIRNSSNKLDELLSQYKYLTEENVLLQEFEFIIKKNHIVFQEELKKLLVKFWVHSGITLNSKVGDESLGYIHAFNYVVKQLKQKPWAQFILLIEKKSKSFDYKEEAKKQNNEYPSPRLSVIVDDDRITNLLLLVNGDVLMELSNTNFVYGLMVAFAFFFVFDVHYPTIFRHILSLIHSVLITHEEIDKTLKRTPLLDELVAKFKI